LHPTGGLISSARDLLRYARFHLGKLPAADGPPLLSEAALREMRTKSGPGGTLTFEIDGMGVNWLLRPTAEGVRVVQWNGDWPGQAASFLFVPERDFAIALLTNADSGPRLRSDLLDGDWALAHFAGLHNPPAVPLTLTPAQLAPYEGDLAFYRDDYGVALDAAGQPTLSRSNFVRGPDGRVTWFSSRGRLHRRMD
jgi:CubicO group peptidase (beta-lactamase class C family)